MDVRDHVAANAREFFGSLKEWLAIPSVLGAPLVFVAVGLDTDRIHAPNERVDTPLLLRGAEAAAYLWEELAAISADLK
jgi:acetylornithine deacetylase/succinyl-diaminopimelate desuccinylase-like protein